MRSLTSYTFTLCPLFLSFYFLEKPRLIVWISTFVNWRSPTGRIICGHFSALYRLKQCIPTQADRMVDRARRIQTYPLSSTSLLYKKKISACSARHVIHSYDLESANLMFTRAMLFDAGQIGGPSVALERDIELLGDMNWFMISSIWCCSGGQVPTGIGSCLNWITFLLLRDCASETLGD